MKTVGFGAWLALLAVLVSGCAALPEAAPPAVADSPWAAQSAAALAADNGAAVPWQHYRLPGKAATRFAYARQDGRDAIAVKAVMSASMLRQPLRIAAADLGQLHFSWKVPALIAQADMARRESDDSPVRVILAFDGDRSLLSPRNALLSELARSVTGEEMPYATLMYVWCNTRAPGTVITSPRTDRIRKLVMESGPTKLNRWLDYDRDIRADFQKAFGEAPGPLIGVAIMTDTDNTRTTTSAWYGPVQFRKLGKGLGP